MDWNKKTKFYQASTSELYGKVQEVPQNETTPFYPRSPYAAAKLYAYWITVNYREAYGIFLPQMGFYLITKGQQEEKHLLLVKKLPWQLQKFRLGFKQKLFLGNLNAVRDWGHARDYVDGMWRILQHDKADDFGACH